jgi:hypothetical protein
LESDDDTDTEDKLTDDEVFYSDSDIEINTHAE